MACFDAKSVPQGRHEQGQISEMRRREDCKRFIKSLKIKHTRENLPQPLTLHRDPPPTTDLHRSPLSRSSFTTKILHPSMQAFVPTSYLPCRHPLPTFRRSITCLAKRTKKRGSGERSRKPRRARGADQQPPPRIDEDNDVLSSELTDQFDEDVKQRLRPGMEWKADKAQNVAEKGPSVIDRLSEFDPRKLTREQTLELLIRGSWIGLGILVGYFFVVHFIIVGDLVPGHGVATPPVPLEQSGAG